MNDTVNLLAQMATLVPEKLNTLIQAATETENAVDQLVTSLSEKQPQLTEVTNQIETALDELQSAGTNGCGRGARTGITSFRTSRGELESVKPKRKFST